MQESVVHGYTSRLLDMRDRSRSHLVDPWETPIIRYTAVICVTKWMNAGAIVSRAGPTTGIKRIAYGADHRQSPLQLQFQMRENLSQQFGIGYRNEDIFKRSAPQISLMETPLTEQYYAEPLTAVCVQLCLLDESKISLAWAGGQPEKGVAPVDRVTRGVWYN